MKKYLGIVSIIGILWALFQIYIASYGTLNSQLQRTIHLAFALGLVFALFRRGEDSKNIFAKYSDYGLVFLSLASGAYIFIEFERLISRTRFVSDLQPFDYFFSIIVTILVLEASRRTVGKAMTILAVVFIAYGFVGPYIPGLLNHSGLPLKRFVEIMFFSGDGIVGIPVGVVVNYVFYFVLFAAFLEISGGGKLIIDIAFKLTGKAKGGPAKAAVFASSGMGTINGSSVANVASTGIFTIPLMKKAGYSPKFAAAIEALSSNGGQIMPPIMGAVAFLMATTLGVPYTDVVFAALIPALLYYVALFIMVHIQADKIKEKNKKTSDIDVELSTDTREILKRFHLLIPLLLLIYLIFSGSSLQVSAFYSIVLLVIISNLFPSTRTGITGTLDAFVNGAKSAVKVTIPCAVAGIIVGVVLHTGLGLKFSSLIIDWSFGITTLSIILIAIGCIIFGMGMPTTSAYIMASILLAPALQDLGFEPMAAHLFILYLAVMSMITPPVALAAYTASGIAGSDSHETGVYAFYLGIPGMIIAFSFLLNPSLLMMGSVNEIVWSSLTTLLGIFTLTISILGYIKGSVAPVYRILFLVTSIMLIIQDGITDTLGVISLICVFYLHIRSVRKRMEYRGEQIA
ncbi:TRAP transporter 4TM/12TM fusion protein [Evansella vedderi]|uniref:TRAP transporter 4TM/12TM fusion protein n=1 Tax=Evansella vedderi TaxID=38282 RepID=A0ABT9ZZA1_9BACI|nr:TRAP transporter fused permease subunit [Evansella vedderi]MDQ0256295.1 TRAP transporter 4TM/12TM fusion protein [Evansella vedderi]